MTIRPCPVPLRGVGYSRFTQQGISMIIHFRLATLLRNTVIFIILAAPLPALAQGPSNFVPEWVQRSNEIAYKVLESGAKFAPEFAAQTGVSGFDEDIFDLGPRLFERQIQNSKDNLEMLQGLLASEEDARVRQDIQIMIKSAEDNIEAATINYERVLPYGNIPGLIFAGFRGLLDKQVPLERQQAALVRLRKYTGREEGFEPLTELAKIRLTERMQEPDLIKPFIGEVEQDLEKAPLMIAGLGQIFAASELEGYEDDLADTLVPRFLAAGGDPDELYFGGTSRAKTVRANWRSRRTSRSSKPRSATSGPFWS